MSWSHIAIFMTTGSAHGHWLHLQDKLTNLQMDVQIRNHWWLLTIPVWVRNHESWKSELLHSDPCNIMSKSKEERTRSPGERQGWFLLNNCISYIISLSSIQFGKWDIVGMNECVHGWDGQDSAWWIIGDVVLKTRWRRTMQTSKWETSAWNISPPVTLKLKSTENNSSSNELFFHLIITDHPDSLFLLFYFPYFMWSRRRIIATESISTFLPLSHENW